MDGWLPWRVTHATHATARRTRRDAYPCIIYISIVVVVVASSSSHRRRAHIRMHHRARHPRVHPSIHPSIHPSTHPPRDATRRDASRDVSTMYTKKITSRARKYYDAAYDANNTTYLDLRRLEGGDAGDEGGREEGRHRVCESVRECRAIFIEEDADDATSRTSDDATIRTSDDATTIRTSDACMATPARAASLVRGRGRHRSMGHRVPVVVIGHIFERSGHTRDRPRGRWCVCVYSI